METSKKEITYRRLVINLPSYRNLILMGGILFVSILIVMVSFAINKPSNEVIKDGKPLPAEAKSLLKELKEKMELPEDETPTIASVTDVAKIDNQPFFRNAKNGDSIIIYATTQKAILYRRSTHKIIEVAPININTELQNLQKAK